MIPGALDHFIDALQTVIRKHGIQLSLTDAAAGHSQVLITGIEDYDRAAAAEFKQLLLQQETTADISMLRMVFSPEEVRVAEGPGKCHVPMLEEWFGVELLLPERAGQPLILRGSRDAKGAAAAFLRRFVAEKL